MQMEIHLSISTRMDMLVVGLLIKDASRRFVLLVTVVNYQERHGLSSGEAHQIDR